MVYIIHFSHLINGKKNLVISIIQMRNYVYNCVKIILFMKEIPNDLSTDCYKDYDQKVAAC